MRSALLYYGSKKNHVHFSHVVKFVNAESKRYLTAICEGGGEESDPDWQLKPQRSTGVTEPPSRARHGADATNMIINFLLFSHHHHRLYSHSSPINKILRPLPFFVRLPMAETNPFVISKIEEDAPLDDPQAHDLDDEVTAADKLGSVEDLIPLCAKHATGPQISTATFGYDIAQMERRPWEEPGAKASDYFNYGFSETSWRLYCSMQAEGEAALLAKSNEVVRKLRLAAFREAGAATAGAGAGAGAGGEDRGAGGAPQPYDPSMGSHHHGFGGGGGGGPGGYERRGPPGPNDPRMSFYKTKICQRFAEGRCAKGSECNYAHGMDELRSAPPMSGGGGGRDGGGGYGGGGPHHQHNQHQHQQQHNRYLAPPNAGGGGYMPPQQQQHHHQYNMAPYQPGANMGPMPGYDGGDQEGYRGGGPKRPRGEGGY